MDRVARASVRAAVARAASRCARSRRCVRRLARSWESSSRRSSILASNGARSPAPPPCRPPPRPPSAAASRASASCSGSASRHIASCLSVASMKTAVFAGMSGYNNKLALGSDLSPGPQVPLEQDLIPRPPLALQESIKDFSLDVPVENFGKPPSTLMVTTPSPRGSSPSNVPQSCSPPLVRPPPRISATETSDAVLSMGGKSASDPLRPRLVAHASNTSSASSDASCCSFSRARSFSARFLRAASHREMCAACEARLRLLPRR
mmetsp:Transcript_78224/g.203264  ORF Transcript_78224/g.203264 Transcript_78224/m.203264 type:complete len:264 (+) Transcript_78224:865-1656(+)